jgi:hypothetical protein
MKKTLLMVLATLIFLLPAYAQDTEQADDSLPISGDAKSVQEEQDSRAARSFSNAIAWSERNRFGFSLGVSEGYISDVFPNVVDKHSSSLTALSSSIFANFGRRKSRLHFDYSAGYRFYQQQDTMNGIDHNGTISYTYPTSRRSQFQLSDMVSSSLNDPFSSTNPSLATTMDWTPSPSYSVLFLPQRVTQNQAEARFSADLTRSTHVSVFGSYNSYWYGKQSFGDINAVQVGAGLDQRITNWLFLTSTYSTYLNSVNEKLRDYQIHRIEIGRFRFMLSKNIEVFASGGLELADTRDKFRIEGMFRGGISRTTETNLLYANYQRTMISALGYTRVLPSDVVSIGVGQRLSEKTNFRLSASYMRSSDFSYSGLLRGYSGQAQFEYALRSDLFASINYTYQYQNNSIQVLQDLPHFDRSMVFGRLQYAWPSIRLKSE